MLVHTRYSTSTWPHHYCCLRKHTYVTSQLRSTSNGDHQEGKSAQNSTTKMKSAHYTFKSVYYGDHDGAHDGAVRIFVGLSCEPGCLISELHNYLHKWQPHSW